MSISAAMQRAEKILMEMTDNETGEFLFYQKDDLVCKIVVEVLVAFFRDSEIRNILLELEK